MIVNTMYKLPNGVHYKILQSGITALTAAQGNSTIDLIYSILTAGGQYMNLQVFGYEKIKYLVQLVVCKVILF